MTVAEGIEPELGAPGFPRARAALGRAIDARRSLLDLWNAQTDAGRDFEISLGPAEDGRVELWVGWSPQEDGADQLDRRASDFVAAIKQALDLAVLEAATTNCRVFGDLDPDDHRFPLCRDQESFAAWRDGTPGLGLRPDQVMVVQELQPFDSVETSTSSVRGSMCHLAAVLATQPNVSIWVSSAQPEWSTASSADVRLTVDEAGAMRTSRRVATFQVVPPAVAAELEANPRVAFDLILDAPPWPMNPDDNIGRRSAHLLAVVRVFIDALERSVELPPLLRRIDLARLAPLAPVMSWLPVRLDDAQTALDIRAAIAESDRGLASYRTATGDLFLLALRDGELVGQEIAEARPLDPAVEVGPAAELATLEGAADWSLPDFVFTPLTVKKGSGIREIGDGTIVAGRRGVALQVKARERPSTDHAKEARWLRKKTIEGSRQAAGTIRTSLRDTVCLANLRGVEVAIPGRHVDWAAVVILDHPGTPETVLPTREELGPGCVPMLRRDWEFIWKRLGSAVAVAEYIHRVKDDTPMPLGHEASRYLELADADAAASPRPVAPWVEALGGQPLNGPVLPRDPAYHLDPVAFGMVTNVLRDVAGSTSAISSWERLMLLSMMDTHAVAHRAGLGRTLLEWLDSCALTPPDQLRAEHRVIFDRDGTLHLVFSVMSTLSSLHLETYRNWVQLRREQFMEASEAKGPIWPWTVAVLLTPRVAGARLWDTTVIATNGPPWLSAEDHARLSELWPVGGHR